MKLGNHELIREQGGIGAGTAWIARAEDDTSESPRFFTVARVHKHLLKKPEVTTNFLADVKPALGFTHANVAALVDARGEGGELFAVSEAPEGEVLSALITAAGASGLPQPVVLRVALDVLEGLAAAHERDPAALHGELGPHHVLVGADGVARILGLGTARALSRISLPMGPKNQERLAYAAPERVKAMSMPGGGASAPLDARSDLFSVGVMLWEGIARQRLFASKIDAAVVQKVLTGPIGSLSGQPGVTVAEALEAAVHKALEREPDKRTSSAALLIAAIEGLDPAQIAGHKDVAELVEKLAGKAIAARRAEALKAPAAKGLSSTPRPGDASAKGLSSTPKPGEAAAPAKAPLPRKATLLGIPAPKLGAPAKAEPAPASSKPDPAAAPITLRAPTPSKPEIKSATSATSTPVPGSSPAPAPAGAKPAIRVDEGLDDDDKDAVEIEPEKTDAGQLSAAKLPPKAEPKAPPPVPAKAPPPPKRGVKAPLSAKPATEQPKPASVKPGATEAPPSVKSGPTPASDKSRGAGTEKVGPGSTLGRYEILMPVARGGMASVWAARLPGSRGFQKIFAIKTMLPDVSDDPDFENMFLDEGRVAARIRHPNVVEIIDLGEQDAVLYLVMEWVDGENLGSLVKAARGQGGIPMPIVLKLASQIAAGLHAAHELRDDDGNLVDLVHRDVSPANVLVTNTGFVKIVDFGIAKSKGRLHQTRVGGVVKGKTPYLSPEQLGQLPIDRRSDIFSFGVLLYVLTTGLHPFRGETDAKTIENIALREPVPLHNIVPTTPPEFEAVVLKALSKDPQERYATAAEMQRAVDHAAAAVGAIATEEDVATFVRQVLGDVLTKRAQELRSSIERADGRGAAAEPAPEPLPTAKPPPPEVIADSVVKTAPVTLHEITLDEEGAKAVTEAAAEAREADSAAADLGPIAGPSEGIGIGIDIDAPAPPPPNEEAFAAAEPALSPHPAVPPPPPEMDLSFPPAPAAEPPPSLDVPSASSTGAPLELSEQPRKRKPMALIAVGAVLGLAVVIGGLALFSGGNKADPPARTGSSTPASTAKATAAPAPTPTPTETAAPAPTPTETAAPAPAETAAPADTTPPAETAAAPSQPVKAPSRPAGGWRPAVKKPPPHKGKTPNAGKYNPPGI